MVSYALRLSAVCPLRGRLSVILVELRCSIELIGMRVSYVGATLSSFSLRF
jgi:hypothetical protein